MPSPAPRHQPPADLPGGARPAAPPRLDDTAAKPGVAAAPWSGRLDAVIFDLDDTLLDWKGAESGAMTHIVAQHFEPAGVGAHDVLRHYAQIHAENLEAFRRDGRWWYVGDRLAILTQRLGTAQSVPGDALTATFKAHVHTHLELLPGAIDAVRAARADGRKVGMLTNGPGHIQRPKIEKAQLEEHFDFVGVTGELGHWKPSPRAFHAVLERLKTPAAATLMVGDSLDFDILPARALGMPTAWIDRDGRRHDAADLVVPSPADLVGHLRQASRSGA